MHMHAMSNLIAGDINFDLRGIRNYNLLSSFSFYISLLPISHTNVEGVK